jgi:hypothetical protein
VYFIGLIVSFITAGLDIFTSKERNSLAIVIGITITTNAIIFMSNLENYFINTLINQEIIESIQQKRGQIFVFGLFVSTGLISLTIIPVAQNWIITILIVYFALNTLVAYWRLYREYKFINIVDTTTLTVLENQDVEVVTL